MTPLFSKAGLVALESFTFTETLYAFDFDGTLAKIVARPGDAAMNPTTERLLRRLNRTAAVAIISGRSIGDLNARIGFKPRYLIGNHGLEGGTMGARELEGVRAVCRDWRKVLSRKEWPAGVILEDKGYSLAMHYRRARNKTEARKRIAAAIAQLQPEARVIPGKLVFNVLPVNGPHKGVAILNLLKKSKLRHALYVGDDDTDEDVFSLPAQENRILTVRVGKKAASQARYFIERQRQMDQLLRRLIEYHERS